MLALRLRSCLPRLCHRQGALLRFLSEASYDACATAAPYESPAAIYGAEAAPYEIEVTTYGSDATKYGAAATAPAYDAPAVDTDPAYAVPTADTASHEDPAPEMPSSDAPAPAAAAASNTLGYDPTDSRLSPDRGAMLGEFWHLQDAVTNASAFEPRELEEGFRNLERKYGECPGSDNSVRVSYYSQRGELDAALQSLKRLRLLGLELDHHTISIAENLADRLDSFPLSKVFEVANCVLKRRRAPPTSFFNNLVQMLCTRSLGEELEWLLTNTMCAVRPPVISQQSIDLVLKTFGNSKSTKLLLTNMSPLRIEASEEFLGELELVFAGDHGAQTAIAAIRASGMPSRDEQIMLQVPQIMPKALLKKHRVINSIGRTGGSEREGGFGGRRGGRGGRGRGRRPRR